MDLGIRDRLALVTGSSQGIGRSIALALAAEGARVILVARQREKLEGVRRELPGGADRHVVIPADLFPSENIESFVKTLVSGPGYPDIVVHNLGGSFNVRDTFASSAEWKKVWDFNLGSVVELNRLILPEMIRKRWGRVVHLSTLSTTTFNGYAPYVSAKCALDGYVKVVGREVAKHNVILSAIAPGAIYSEGRYFAKIQKENPSLLDEYFRQHLPAGRLGTAEEVGRATAFLCSEQAGFMTGAIVAFDGGGM